jgi:hypothetical protein
VKGGLVLALMEMISASENVSIFDLEHMPTSQIVDSVDRDLLLLLDPHVDFFPVTKINNLNWPKQDQKEKRKKIINEKNIAWRPNSFHFDPNVREVKLASTPMRALLLKALTLLADYPGNEVLMQVNL